MWPIESWTNAVNKESVLPAGRRMSSCGVWFEACGRFAEQQRIRACRLSLFPTGRSLLTPVRFNYFG